MSVQLGMSIGAGLVRAGLDIFDVLSGKDDLTAEDIQEIIARENAAQEERITRLQELLAAGDN